MNKKNKPLVIPVFIPHSGCPHQCAFCNQSIITSQSDPLPDGWKIKKIVNEYLQYKGQRTNVELAFFGGNFLGLPKADIQMLLASVTPFLDEKVIDGIRCSTRPDTVTKEMLELVKPYGMSCIELGVQSMDDHVLEKSRRGHNKEDTIRAVGLLKEFGFKTGVQMMVGLPGDDELLALGTAKEIASLSPDFVRIYPLMVLKGSLMETWYVNKTYLPLSLDESIDIVKKLYLIFQASGIEVVRMGLQSSDLMEDESMVLAGPWHPAFGHLVLSSLFLDKACDMVENMKDRLKSNAFVMRVHPASESRLRGNKYQNLEVLKHKFPGYVFSVKKDDRLKKDEVKLSS